MADIIPLDATSSLEMIKETMEVRKIALVRSNVFGKVRCREWTALERTRQRAIAGGMVHVRRRYDDLEVLG